MDYSADTPFRTYKDIQTAVQEKRAILSYNRATAYHIACRVSAINVVLNIIIPFVSIALMFVACKVYDISMWVLLFGIIALVLYAQIPYWKNALIIIAIFLIAIPLFILKNAMWLLGIGVGIIGMLIGYYIWWSIIANVASGAIMTNESLFESVWTDKNVALRTNNTINGFYTYQCGKGKL